MTTFIIAARRCNLAPLIAARIIVGPIFQGRNNITVKLAGYSIRIGAGPDETLEDQVAYYARVSNPSSQMSGMNNKRLISYLIRHGHWSPFEMVTVTLEIETSRDIGRQLLRHRSFSFQEFSQRYSATETTCSTREARMQDHTNRQNSIQTDDADLKHWWTDQQIEVMDTAFSAYDAALKRWIAKEVARAILPEGLTWTRLYMTGSLRSWIHFVNLRTKAETQKEARELAVECVFQIERVFPQIVGVIQND